MTSHPPPPTLRPNLALALMLDLALALVLALVISPTPGLTSSKLPSTHSQVTPLSWSSQYITPHNILSS